MNEQPNVPDITSFDEEDDNSLDTVHVTVEKDKTQTNIIAREVGQMTVINGPVITDRFEV